MIDIIAGRESTKYPPNQQAHLFAGVAEILEQRSGQSASSGSFYPQSSELGYDDQMLALEIFWDLILERIITPGSDMINPLPFFRVHSEATNL